MIPSRNYFDPGVLGDEVSALFGEWQFVGTAEELANNRDFICVDLPGVSIVVQNFAGELRAFKNVCTHRLNRIQFEDRGNRHLMCRYHGWTFDRDGSPRGIPDKQAFAPDAAARARLCLKSYPVATCGRFVFVSMRDRPQPLARYLGSFAETLEQISEAMGAEIHFEVIPHKANWKLLVENVLECYHCAVVHTETFVAGLGVGKKPIEDIRFAGLHSSSHFPRTETKRENARKRVVAHLADRPLAHNSFFHVFIFPNLFISSTEGTAFYVGHALPSDYNETKLRARFFEPNVEFTPRLRALQDAVNQQGIQLGVRVIEEDRQILENVQLGTQAAGFDAVLGNEEVRIKAFADAYQASMTGMAYEAPADLSLCPGVGASPGA